MVSYKIQDNGGIPFIVDVTRNNIKVYLTNFSADCTKNSKTIMIGEFIDYKKIFVSIDASVTTKFDGVSLLIQLDDTKYVFIGTSIYEFKSNEQIIKFYSKMGNNDVPYSWGLTENIVYFFEDQSFIKSSEIWRFMPAYSDPYMFLYGMNEDIYTVEGKTKLSNIFTVDALKTKILIKRFKENYTHKFIYDADKLKMVKLSNKELDILDQAKQYENECFKQFECKITKCKSKTSKKSKRQSRKSKQSKRHSRKPKQSKRQSRKSKRSVKRSHK